MDRFDLVSICHGVEDRMIGMFTDVCMTIHSECGFSPSPVATIAKIVTDDRVIMRVKACVDSDIDKAAGATGHQVRYGHVTSIASVFIKEHDLEMRLEPEHYDHEVRLIVEDIITFILRGQILPAIILGLIKEQA